MSLQDRASDRHEREPSEGTLRSEDISVYSFAEIDSTLREAERRIVCGGIGERACLILAATQTGGFGRVDRRWMSPPGNLYWTLVVPIPAAAPVDHGPTFAACLAVADLALSLGVRSDAVSLKWPNDPLVFGKKIAGVLVQNHGAPRATAMRSYAAIGIGVNIATFPQDAFYPSTSFDAAGIATTVADGAEGLLRAYVARHNTWLAGGIAALMTDHRARLHGCDQPMTISLSTDRSNRITGINRGVEDDGALRVERAAGRIFRLHSGDVLPPLPSGREEEAPTATSDVREGR